MVFETQIEFAEHFLAFPDMGRHDRVGVEFLRSGEFAPVEQFPHFGEALIGADAIFVLGRPGPERLLAQVDPLGRRIAVEERAQPPVAQRERLVSLLARSAEPDAHRISGLRCPRRASGTVPGHVGRGRRCRHQEGHAGGACGQKRRCQFSHHLHHPLPACRVGSCSILAEKFLRIPSGFSMRMPPGFHSVQGQECPRSYCYRVRAWAFRFEAEVRISLQAPLGTLKHELRTPWPAPQRKKCSIFPDES